MSPAGWTRGALAAALAALLVTGGCRGSSPEDATVAPVAEDAAAATTTATHVARADDAAVRSEDGGEDGGGEGSGPLALWSAVDKGKLPSGLTYYIVKHQEPRERAMVWLAVNAGSILEDDDQRGLAHFVEHMAFNGTKRFEHAAIVDYLESIGMRFGADTNAYTSYDDTVYQLEVPTDKPEFLEKALDILRDWAGDVSFDPDEIEKERGVVLEEWRLGLGARRRLMDKQAPVIFAGSRYAERMPIGLEEVIKTAPREAFLRFYRKWYRPDLMAVIVVGDVDPEAVKKEIVKRFGDWPAATDPAPRPSGGVPKIAEQAPIDRISVESDPQLPQAGVAIFNVVPHRPESTAADLRRGVVEQVFTTLLDERFGEIARREGAPVFGAGTAVTGLTRTTDAFIRSATVKGDKVEDALVLLLTEVLRAERHGFSDAELARAKAIVRQAYESYRLESASTESSVYAAELTRNFFEDELVVGPERETDIVLAALPDVSVADIEALSKSFGGADNRVFEVTGPEGMMLPSRERVLAIVAEVEASEIGPWEETSGATELMEAPPAPGKIVAEKTLDKIGVTEWTLSNGARVVVKPTDFEADSFTIAATSPGGLSMVDDARYPQARIAEEGLGVGGLGALDITALRQVLAGKKAAAATVVDETSEGIRGGGSPRDLETVMQLTYLRITSPRKDDQALAVWRDNFAESLENAMRVPETRFTLEWREALFGNHARAMRRTPEEVRAFDADQALKFHQERFGDVSDFVFVIVGAVDLAKLRPLVETYLASLPGKGRIEEPVDRGIHRVSGERTWELGQDPKASVSLTFSAREPWTRDNERDLAILDEVLDIRLREVLREDMGGVYGVSTGGALNRDAGPERTFAISFGCAPDKVDELIAATFEELARIEGGESESLEEIIAKVREAFLRKREVELRDNGFWTGWLLRAYRYGDDPTLILDPSGILGRMTKEHVQATAERVVEKKDLYRAVLLPAPAAP